jgi:hypothetical protein
MPDNFRHQFQQIGASHQNMMLNAEMVGGCASEVGFVVFFLREPDGEGLHLLAKAAHQPREQRVRIETSAQEQPERNIASQPQPKAVVDLRFYFFERLRITAFCLGGLLKPPVTANLDFALTPEQVMRGREFPDLAHHCLRRRNKSEHQISGEGLGINFPLR